MSFINEIVLPTPDEIKELMPLSDELKKIKAERDAEIAKVFKGESDKFILIVGPCSANNEEAVIDYTSRLGTIQKDIEDKILLIPRVYTNKPRTTGEGYKGMLHQPDPTEKPDILEGIKAIRRLHMNVLKSSGLTTADEMLYPTNYRYLDDLLGYVAVGARSVENQKHRLTASGIDVPVGLKNPTSGDLGVMLNSIKASQLEHSFIYSGSEVQTTGNELAHGILRGYVDQYGRNFPNYHYEEAMYLEIAYSERGLKNQSVIIDTNHANSMKQFHEQPRIAMEVMRNRKYNEGLKKMIKGLMIESYIVEGKQSELGTVYGQSITDACLGWEDTEQLIFKIYKEL